MKPIFHRIGGTDQLVVAFSATTSPHAGYRRAGAGHRGARAVRGGLHIPLTQLIRGRAGPTRRCSACIRANVRTPDQTVGDIWAQVSANQLMDARVRSSSTTTGWIASTARRRALFFGRSEKARCALRSARRSRIGTPLAIRAWTPTASRSHISLALAPHREGAMRIIADLPIGTLARAAAGHQLRHGSMPTPRQRVRVRWRCALCPGCLNNEGMYRPVKAVAPEGCLLNPRISLAAVVSRARDQRLTCRCWCWAGRCIA